MPTLLPHFSVCNDCSPGNPFELTCPAIKDLTGEKFHLSRRIPGTGFDTPLNHTLTDKQNASCKLFKPFEITFSQSKKIFVLI